MRRVCSFCGLEIAPGTGKMFIRRDGSLYHFCGSKCQKNLLQLNRIPRRIRWTEIYHREKRIRLKDVKKDETKKEESKKEDTKK